MAPQKHLLVLVLLACLNSFAYAYQFYVGGRAGWVPNPSANYNSWAERMRFQVNDTLVFKYKKGSSSVLVVNKEDYDKCNTANPIKKMDDGNSLFKFDHSGPFFFVSGNKDDCENGQKLIIVVLAIRPPPPLTPTPPTTPSHGPVAAAPKGTTTPISPSPNGTPVPAPLNPTPVSSPVNAPTPATSPASHASSGNSPTSSPAPANSSGTPPESPAPAKTSPSSAPSGAITSPSPSSSGSSSSPTSSPPAPSTAGSISPAASSGNTPADIHSPTGSPPNTKKNSAVKSLTTTSAVLVSTVLTIAFVVCP